MLQPTVIKGGSFRDMRGNLRFVNGFLMDKVKRMYIIEQLDTVAIRAWQGHKLEQKWFFVLEGAFHIQLVQPDNWESPSKDLFPRSFNMLAENNEVLHVPGGFANGFRATENNSKLLVFSNFNIKQVEMDNYRFEKDYWNCW